MQKPAHSFALSLPHQCAVRRPVACRYWACGSLKLWMRLKGCTGGSQVLQAELPGRVSRMSRKERPLNPYIVLGVGPEGYAYAAKCNV